MNPFTILHVNHSDTGGAARIAVNLCAAYRQRGLVSFLATASQQSSFSHLIKIPPNQESMPPLNRLLLKWADLLYQKQIRIGSWQLSGLLRRMGEPDYYLSEALGREYFNYPGSRDIFQLIQPPPDILHLHNLHTNYFDLRILPSLSQKVPLVITLHDTWLMSGHCGYSLDCQRWQTGCGHCPYPWVYPQVKRDATAKNWLVKKKIFESSRIYIAAPSQWILDQAKQSILTPAIIDSQVIHNGVDLTLFCPADQLKARQFLNLPQDAFIVLFVADKAISNYYKDFSTVQKSVELAAQKIKNQNVVFVSLGGENRIEQINQAKIYHVPFQTDSIRVAAYYQAADVYIHAARADNFPNVILEAQACGLPVIATAVGGIPEQIIEGETGFLTPAADSEAVASRLVQLANDHVLAGQMRVNSTRHAQLNFDLNQQVSRYLSWYQDILRQKDGKA